MEIKRRQLNWILLALFILLAFSLPKLSQRLGLFEVDWKEYYQEVIDSHGKGKIIKLTFSKGGDGTLTLRNNRIKSEVLVSNKNVHLVRKGDYFIKIKNSNKCMIKRNDSIIYIDCINFYPPEIRDSFDEIQEWPRKIVGKWQKHIIPKR